MKFINNQKGVILIVVSMVIVVLLILTAIFFSATLSERRFADTEKFAIQALSLAEAGANHGVSELRKRIRSDFSTNVQSVTSGSQFLQYMTNPLALLKDYAGTGFVISGVYPNADYALSNNIAPLAITSGIQGSYSAVITVAPNGSPTKSADCSDINPDACNYFNFPYKYRIQGIGSVTETQPAVLRTINLVDGEFAVNIIRNNYARYALFTNNHSWPGGGTVWFTSSSSFSGPVHTNSRFSFYGNPAGTFSDAVTQHLTTARFYNNNPIRHKLADAESNPPYDVPNFLSSFERGVTEINFPSSVNQQEIKEEALGGSAEPHTTGVYVPVNESNVVSGGIYVRGDARINLDEDATDLTNKAVFTITQGSTATVITVEYAHDTVAANTTVKVGSNPKITYSGIPDGITNEGPLIYAAGGQITIEDTSDSEVIIQKRTNMTISCENDIVIQDNIHYQEYTPSPLSAEGYDNMLGLIVWGGNSDVRIGTSAPNNIDIHGIIMAEQGVFKVDDHDTGSLRGTATLLGGVITQFYGPFGTFSGDTQLTGYLRNFVYDKRAETLGTHPPYFPALDNFISYDDGGLDSRLSWQEEGG